MRGRGLLLLVLLLCLLPAAVPAAVAAADALPIGQLLSNAPNHDGQVITMEGEALGDVLRRGDRGWINIGDGTGVIGVWARAQDLDAIQSTGTYGHVGDRVRVTGTFHRSAGDLGGDTALVADSLAVVAPGYDQPRPVGLWRVLLALVLAALAVGLALTWRRRFRSG